MSNSIDGKHSESGFFAETAQVAVASYQPHLPQNGSLDTYLDDLVRRAQAAIGLPGAAPELA
jgi:hypothetical protein